ncbi:hypothetical protein SLE2022_313580 [Rubroshorea leprosula]
MGFISLPKPYQWNPRVYPTIPKSSIPYSLNPLHFFTTTQDSLPPDAVYGAPAAEPEALSNASVQGEDKEKLTRRVRQGKHRNPEKVEIFSVE